MPATVDKTRAGFTLVELLVAVALAVIITGVAVVVFAQGSAVFLQTHAKIEAVHSAQVALDFLEKDLQGAYLETEQLLLGVYDESRGKIDNNRDGLIDANDELVNFDNTTDAERHGLEFLSMSQFALDEDGQPVPAIHTLYYISWDGTSTMGRLIRCTEERDANPVVQFIDPAGDLSALDPEDNQAIAYGVKQFRLRYYRDGSWYDPSDSINPAGWDSTNPAGWDQIPATPDDIQYSTLPQFVEVQLTVVDSDGTLDKAKSNPIVIRRLIPVGTTVP